MNYKINGNSEGGAQGSFFIFINHYSFLVANALLALFMLIIIFEIELAIQFEISVQAWSGNSMNW